MKIPLVWLKDYVEVDASPREIADAFTRIGLMLDKPVGEDNVLDLEQRLNRSDLLSILGCARDLAVFEKTPLREPKIKMHKPTPATPESYVPISVKSKAVNRFNTRVFRGITVAPSPKWLQERLELYGIDSINNIVDITNFVMTELGQTMHAQDIAKLPKQEIVIRQAKAGEKITTLLGTDVALDKDIFVLASGGIPQVIGGIVGGLNSGVTEETTDIVLDAGNYDPRIIRRNSRKLKIFNESVSHNDKPLDPRLTEIALSRATNLILELAGGTYYANEDYYPNPVTPQTLTLTEARLQLISGQNISLKEAKTILSRLGYAIVDEAKESLTVEAPYYRTDLEVEDDLISDVLRMRDYNTIPSTSLNTAIPIDITPDIYRFEDKLRDYMVALGGHEHITTQLVQNDGNPDRIVLENALSSDQNSLRMSALETLPIVSQNYAKQGMKKHIIFEIGKSFVKKGFTEIRELVIIDSEDICSTVATLMHSLGLSSYELQEESGEGKIVVGKKIVGSIKLGSSVLSVNELQKVAAPYPPLTSDFAHTTTLDISLSYPASLHFAFIASICRMLAPTPSMVEVVEEFEEWKLVRLTWNKHVKNLDEIRRNLVLALKEKGVRTRSG